MAHIWFYKMLPPGRKLIGLFIMVLLTLVIFQGVGEIRFSNFQNDALGQEDYLIYVLREDVGKGQLMFFDSARGVHLPILLDWDVGSISISVKNRLAFSSSHEGNNEIYILDYPFTDSVPVNISQSVSTEDTPMAWSPDGRYLAYKSIQDSGETVSIWDGTAVHHIDHSAKSVNEFNWSLDGRLAFTEFYAFSFPYEGDRSEIFIWDGDAIENLSQNPLGEDRYPVWNADGQLAFLSNRQGEYDIFIWDGMRKIDGMPDTNTFMNIAPNMTDYYSTPVWTTSGSLAFIAFGPEDSHAQIYEWNGQIATNISQNPDLHNGGQRWREDGYWSFTTFFSRQQLIYVRDNKNQTKLVLEGGSSAWGETGNLIFCTKVPSGWSLSMWNGSEILEIAQSFEIEAFWRNGKGVICSSG